VVGLIFQGTMWAYIAAAAARRSLAALIEKLLIDHCEKEGIEIRKPKRGKRQ